MDRGIHFETPLSDELNRFLQDNKSESFAPEQIEAIKVCGEDSLIIVAPFRINPITREELKKLILDIDVYLKKPDMDEITAIPRSHKGVVFLQWPNDEILFRQDLQWIIKKIDDADVLICANLCESVGL